ncbi:hypothetical protein PTTG_29879 [Puccinia triticina 1-1 BBBD Race 1]|uniref:Uncharacterized protein n=1 Tax=Puccinia triticina (isolate 1-1 / race 1 (BBBD)) TaxID=630390 RepID=A0A180G1B3_PUCT1|nr:hypothetical protein PTTG_29879 [Puccinia triticina 1-1 BBBD Race 1]WAR54753.1 hypothetical protein PtB15_4B370 [Puccinia triticina]
MFSDALLCLKQNQLAGVVSSSLIATCGLIPLTILSVIPDIMQHYYDCIVLAQHKLSPKICRLSGPHQDFKLC